MARDGWDFGDIQPNLSKLPPHLRENISKTLPLRPYEVHSRIFILRKSPGLNHPNGRVNVSDFYKDAVRPTGVPDGAQIDTTDFSGRLALASFILAKDKVTAVISGLAKSYMRMGGTREELLAAIDEVVRPPKLTNHLIPEATDE